MINTKTLLGLALLSGQAQAAVTRYYAVDAPYFKAKEKGSDPGFLDFDGFGSSVIFSVDLPSSGDHTFTVQYVTPNNLSLIHI